MKTERDFRGIQIVLKDETAIPHGSWGRNVDRGPPQLHAAHFHCACNPGRTGRDRRP